MCLCYGANQVTQFLECELLEQSFLLFVGMACLTRLDQYVIREHNVFVCMYEKNSTIETLK